MLLPLSLLMLYLLQTDEHSRKVRKAQQNLRDRNKRQPPRNLKINGGKTRFEGLLLVVEANKKALQEEKDEVSYAVLKQLQNHSRSYTVLPSESTIVQYLELHRSIASFLLSVFFFPSRVPLFPNITVVPESIKLRISKGLLLMLMRFITAQLGFLL